MANNLTTDGIEQLKGCKLPLVSFSFIGFIGAAGTGKTTQMQNIADEIIRWSKSTTYDLDKPQTCNGSLTHNIFISPSTQTDHTLKQSSKTLI